ncbi:hypothetical protein J7T55_010854 [Diaporthe amygdali]|uniref:uncharacterized protein n=1 Tax=Phomopsis amygdali TaxID=1214568 RepID=UPI0022FE85E7|nr:uncharacterized protein J7T55_010854 [Diaporthe amygdali]KAJ0114464.1 hypothetical protein J7T55_010854 [Diaporthe amygdali]
MHSKIIIAAFLASIASSSPVSVTRSESTLPFTGNVALPEEYNSTLWVPGTVLKAHQVLLFGENRAEVVDQDVWTNLIEPQLNQLHAVDETAGQVISTREEHWDEKRECQEITSAVTDKTENFVDWDVQMSPVIHGVGARTVVTVTQGYSVTNGLTVGGGLDYTFTKDILKGALKIDYSHSWTTTYQAAMAYEVTEGYSGTVVTKPTVTRRTGRILKGCIGRQTSQGTFSATSHEEGQRGGLTWVQGNISLCQKQIADGAPLSRCNGGGNFI